jgi:hypothetical protein
MKARATLPDRIDVVMNGSPMTYGDIARSLWDSRSRAWCYSSNGGPPGCYMALSAALRRGKFNVEPHERGKSASHRLVYPRVVTCRKEKT